MCNICTECDSTNLKKVNGTLELTLLDDELETSIIIDGYQCLDCDAVIVKDETASYIINTIDTIITEHENIDTDIFK